MDDSDTDGGLWIPNKVIKMLETGAIGTREFIVLAIVASLVSSSGKCFASNEYIAKRAGCSVTRTREIITELKKSGLIKIVKFDGRRRHLTTKLIAKNGEKQAGRLPTSRQADCRHLGRQTADISAGALNNIDNNIDNMSAPVAGADGVGFGIVKKKAGNTTEFDTTIAIKLLAACRAHLGSSHPNIAHAKITNWAKQIHLLRTTDAIEEKRIAAVLEWYSTAIGGEFIPEVFSGESFRKKFPALEMSYQRNAMPKVEITKQAEGVIKKLRTLVWPAPADEQLPAAVQLGMDDYTDVCARFRGFVAKLKSGELAGKYDKHEADRLLRFGEHLLLVMPPAYHFIEMWMFETWERLMKWEGWDGELMPHRFKSGAARWRTTGYGWSVDWCGYPGLWGEFCKAVKNNEG